jgi:membrane fusion protein, heavy metal efflux system
VRLPGTLGRRIAAAVAVAALGSAVGVGVIRARGKAKAAAAAPVPTRDIPTFSGKGVVFSKEFRERAGMKSVAVRRAPLTPVLALVGVVSFDPAHMAAAGSRIQGFVSAVLKVEGDVVQQGEALAEIESADLGRAQADLRAAQATQTAAELNEKRETDLFGRNLTTAREQEVARATLDQQRAVLRAAQQRVTAYGGNRGAKLGVYTVRAPIRGTVVERHISPGQSVQANLTTFRVADLDHLWIELSIFERDMAVVHVGDMVELQAASDPTRRIQGKVAHVGEVVSLQTRTAEIRVTVDNHERLLRPGQSVTARVRAAGRTREALLVPIGATTFIDGKATVFVADGDTRAVPTEVTLGATDGVSVEVRSGLAEGQIVLADGVSALKNELFR